jgi:magnesium-protoporphyrin IX monomethyl ester (oxidative) cyclase
VFRITSEISRQVFPVELDLDNPRLRTGLDRLWRITQASAAAKEQRTLAGTLKRVGLTAAAAVTVLRLFLLKPKANPLPTQVRLEPAW